MGAALVCLPSECVTIGLTGAFARPIATMFVFSERGWCVCAVCTRGGRVLTLRVCNIRPQWCVSPIATMLVFNERG